MPTESHRLPLLRDWHTHPLLYSAFLGGVNLGEGPEPSRESAITRIREHAARVGPGWTIAHGWNSGRYPLAASDFDGLSPVVVLNVSLHGLIVNQAGRDLLRATSADLIDHLDDQEWIERHLMTVLNVFAREGASPERLRRFFDHLLTTHGIRAVDEMLLVGADEIRLFEEAGLLDRVRFWAAPELYDALPDDDRRQVHGIKLFTDGALGTRTAALRQPYRDAESAGLLIQAPGELESILARYAHHPIAIHAIGDRAIDRVVAAVETAGLAHGRVRLEHAQFITEPVARRAKALGITLCMQPNFSDDSRHYAERLPEGYAERNNPVRMLIDVVGFTPGVDLLFGSDGMPHGVTEALRQSLFPPYPGQILTLDEFRAGYCPGDADAGRDATGIAGHIDATIDREAQSVACRIVC